MLKRDHYLATCDLGSRWCLQLLRVVTGFVETFNFSSFYSPAVFLSTGPKKTHTQTLEFCKLFSLYHVSSCLNHRANNHTLPVVSHQRTTPRLSCTKTREDGDHKSATRLSAAVWRRKKLFCPAGNFEDAEHVFGPSLCWSGRRRRTWCKLRSSCTSRLRTKSFHLDFYFHMQNKIKQIPFDKQRTPLELCHCLLK